MVTERKMLEFTDLQTAAMKPLNAELHQVALEWRNSMELSLAMSINWPSFWQDTSRSQQATLEALRFMVDCGSKRLLKCYAVSPHNAFFNRNKKALSKLSGYQLIWVDSSDDVRLEIRDGILKDYFHVEGFVQYYANLDPFFESLFQGPSALFQPSDAADQG